MTYLRQHWLSLTIAVTALVVVLGAPSAALDAGHRALAQITGKQIKNGTIQTKDLSPPPVRPCADSKVQRVRGGTSVRPAP